MNFSIITINIILAFLLATPTQAEIFNIIDFAPTGTKLDRTGKEDTSAALASAIMAANALTAMGRPACIYIPSGVYRIIRNPPQFARAGCLKGDGPTQSTIQLDPTFTGDLFTWSEAWYATSSGPTVTGIRILGSLNAPHEQNALVFYDRNDEVFLDQVEINDLPGRALYSGATRHTSQAYMRESHLRSLRFFRDGSPTAPVVEFNSAGDGQTDATNEIRVSQLDIYGSRGPSLVIRNAGKGAIRNITINDLRIEGREQDDVAADLLRIGDFQLTGRISNITLTGLELINGASGYAAFRIVAPEKAEVPYLIVAHGSIGGLTKGEGLRIDAGRTSAFHLTGISSVGTNVVLGKEVSQILLDGNGMETCWRYQIDPSSRHALYSPQWSETKVPDTMTNEPLKSLPKC